MEIILESMMLAERGEFLRESSGNKGNSVSGSAATPLRQYGGMAGYECQVGKGLPVIQAYAQQRRLQGLYDLFELCPGDAVHD